MELYTVIAKKGLNKRTVPITDFADKKNIAGVVLYNFSFQAEEVPEMENSLGKWYRDRDGYYYWGGGLIKSSEIKAIPEIAPPIDNFSDFWFNELGIAEIWDKFSEKGENAKVLILDSGINTDLVQIASAIEEPAKNFVPGSTSIKNSDQDFHGTHCGSLIAARSNTQFIGAAPATKLYVGKITESGRLDNSSTMKEALKEFLDDKYEIDLISISQELILEDHDLQILIGQHLKKSRIVIASIGNDPEAKNRPYKRYPGSFEECISVGSCTNNKTISDFSMNPDNTNIFCFGENILSYKDSSEPKPLTGTSQATAIVAGICCLIVSWLQKNHFTYNHNSVRQLLRKYSINMTGAGNHRFIQPLIIFNKLQTFITYENKDLQHCIDSDNIDIV
jgi:hypothetical protein